MENNFALFAQMKSTSQTDGLVIPAPMEYTKRTCRLQSGVCEEIAPKPQPVNVEELKLALAQMRQQYAPFLQDLAPATESKRQVLHLIDFELDGQAVTIPHYDGPVGPAVKHYKTEFALPCFDSKAIYLCCGGADYWATVYVNGRCVGMHEGFFSPFEFEITRYAKVGMNTLEIVLENDYPFTGPHSEWITEPISLQGDKIYAATGLGYDESVIGWHHCPPGMGLYHSVTIEIRDPVHITDLYIRPLPGSREAEAWIEVENAIHDIRPIQFRLNLYGQNFAQTVFENLVIDPQFMDNPLVLHYGKHLYKVTLKIPDAKIWTLDAPWLYQLQVSVVFGDQVCDTVARQFGMRTFTQDLVSNPKGMFYLNGEPIRLRGANTMGFEQLDVMRGDYDQLIDDILLAKLCNMNFWRVTQRPVQDEVYQYCDRLGFLTQCDLPLFGFLRRTKGCECARQVEEMVRLVRKHPCHTVITYINERWVNARKQPHRHMLHEEMEDWFEIFDRVVRFNFPDAVIKHCDGDFDPPTRNTMPDVHCYTLWYNGGQQDFGLLHRGYGQAVADRWYYGCGEYGAEALDFPEVIRKDYPAEWSKEPFDPGNIVASQTKEWHGNLMDTQDTMEQWCEVSQNHQAYAMKIMTEAYRRDPRMISTAIHLFIDAYPSGWMKAIMDYRRVPKAAYFTSRDALAPVLISLRSDRFSYYAGETASIEAYICNDTNNAAKDGAKLVYQLYRENQMCMCGQMAADYTACDVSYMANVEFQIPTEDTRAEYVLKAFLLDPDGSTLADQSFAFSVFPDVVIPQEADTVWITKLENGTHEIAGETVTVADCPHCCGEVGAVYFLSRKTGHPAVAQFQPNDFRMWYDKKLDRITPIAKQCFRAEGFRPVLICNGSFDPWIVVGEKVFDGKRYIISLADLRCENPAAKHLIHNLM